MFRVLSATIIRSTIKTADAIIGTDHVSASAVLTVLLMMGAESTRNLAEKNKYDCLKLHNVGYLIK
jgi:hypothetical protein